MSATKGPTMVKKNLLQLFVQSYTTESNRSYKIVFVILATLITSLSIVLASVGASHINAPWDVFILLDGSWRILKGQIPHADFYNPIGSLTYLAIAFGMKVAHPSTSSIGYGNILLLIVLMPWAWAIARSRLSAVNAFLLVLFLAFLLVTPRALGYSVRDPTYAMLYNRQGFVLFSMLLVELFISPRASVRHKYFFSGLSSGILLALLLFCKVTYFGFAIAAVFVHIFLFRCPLMWAIGLVSGFSLICAGMQFFFRISLSAYILDIKFASQAQSISDRWTRLNEGLRINLFYILLTFLPLLLSSIDLPKRKKQSNISKETIKVWITTTFVVASGVLISTGNTQNGRDIPLFFIAGLVAIAYLLQQTKLDDLKIGNLSQVNYLVGTLILVPLLCSNILVKDIAGVAYATSWHQFKLSSVEESQRFESTTLHDFVIPQTSDYVTAYWRAREVPQKINEGLALLRQYVSKDSRVFSMTYTNPFPFALELPSPRGAPLWWDLNLSFNKEFFPKAETIFQDTNMVMVPKFGHQDPGCCMETVDLMQELYGDYLKQNFLEKDSSQTWRLLVKR
jgi:hypothetical protein